MSCLMLIAVCCCLSVVVGTITELWSLEQLNDMILSDAWKYNVPARTPAVIALYETQCKKKLTQKYKFNDENMPNSLHLMLASFDRKIVKDTIWYEWNPKIMDVFERYNITNTTKENEKKWCPTIIFQPANWSLPVKKYRHSKKSNLKEWISNFLKTNITFHNTLHENLFLTMNNENHDYDIESEQIIATIEPSSSTSLPLYASNIIVVKNGKNQIVNRYVINTIDKSYNIVQSQDENIINTEKFEDWLTEKKRLQDNRDWSTRRRYLNNIRGPPLMPAFTKTGFEQLKVPNDICEYMLQFWNTGQHKKIPEDFPKDGTEINTREVPTYMLHLPGDKKRWIAERIRPLLEKWSGVPLVYSTIYGLREYINGGVLKTHVDRVETHIVSAILHVKHEPENISWPLEVVSYDGKRYRIEDQQCDMIYYESSKLIHGRPFTYNGSSWVNAFLHFRPADWDSQGYVFTPDNIIQTPSRAVPLVDFIYG